MALVVGRGIEGFDVEGAVGLEDAAVDFVEILESLLVDDGEQFLAGK